MNRILLTGASGTVGKEVLKQLTSLPDRPEVTVFDIKCGRTVAFYNRFRGKIKLVYGDLSDKKGVCQVCSDKDIVIHLAAIIPPLADKEPSLAEKVNISGTQNLVKCIEKLSPGAFFLYSSSISVYGDRNDNYLIRTTDPLKPSDRDEYARTKIAAEKIVTGSNLNWSVFRLTAIMGINNHKPSALMFHMPLDSHLEIATPRDTGRAFVKAPEHLTELNRNIFNLSGGEQCRITYADFMSRSFEIFGLGKPDFKVYSFARKNFHCGYYEDGDVLNEILDFRRDSIEDYFKMVQESINPLRKLLTSAFRNVIKSRLQKQSEPLLAMMTGNKKDIEHFF
jgi:cholest-5-ene-3beta,7alpha-diol 3beta-dehydrogenase